MCYFAGITDRVDVSFEKLPGFMIRKRAAANDPVACAKFFYITINAFLKYLLGFGTEEGIFGEVSAYYGTVEMQGGGTLHFHCIVWLVEKLP